MNTKKGLLEGLMEVYYENGQLRRKGNYKNNKREGLWEYFKQDGSLEKTETYENDIKIQ